MNATFKNNSRGPFITITTAEEETRIISVASHSELTGIWFGPDSEKIMKGAHKKTYV